MKPILFIVLTICLNQVFAGAIPGVPNDLRRQFKSVHKFKEIKIPFKGGQVSARLDLNEKHPILFYNIPKNFEAEAIKELVEPLIPENITFAFAKKLNQEGREYHLKLNNQQILNSWIQVYDVPEMGTIAIGVNLPTSNKVISFNDNQPMSYYLNNGKIIEKRETQQGNGVLVETPQSSQLPNRIKNEMVAVLDPAATVERIQLEKGGFPDQIVIDKDGHIWFTQPDNDLLTSYDPVNKQWLNVNVGNSPDGLFIDKAGQLWFGEYGEGHLGVYNPKTKEYKHYEMPYKKSVPAIPYEDHNGLIWISDHENNKVSVFDPNTQTWLANYESPTTNSWIVQLIQGENGKPDIYATHCSSNSIGHINYDTRVYQEIQLGVSNCPAFFAAVGDLLFISQWTSSSYLTMNIETKEIREYEIKNSAWVETGLGPTTRDQHGNIYFASLREGRLYKFNQKSQTMTYANGLRTTKDGISVDNSGNVWVTESNGTIIKVNFSN